MLHFPLNRRHAAGSIEISSFVFTMPIDHTYVTGHVLSSSAHAHKYNR